MPPEGFEPTIPASEWPETQALDRAATGIGRVCAYHSELPVTRSILRFIPSAAISKENKNSCTNSHVKKGVRPAAGY